MNIQNTVKSWSILLSGKRYVRSDGTVGVSFKKDNYPLDFLS